MFNIDMWHLIPKAFYPYPSTVINRFMEVRCDSKEQKEEFVELEKSLVNLFNEAEIKAHQDNKTVYECTVGDSGKSIFFGFYDWVFSVGVDVLQRQ